MRKLEEHECITAEFSSTSLSLSHFPSFSLSLSLFPLHSPAFSPFPFPLCRGCTACRLCSSDAVTHRFSILAKCPRTVIFLRWLAVAPHPPLFVSKRVILCWISTYHRFQPPNIIDSILLVSNRQITDDDLRESNDGWCHLFMGRDRGNYTIHIYVCFESDLTPRFVHDCVH